MAQGYAIRLSRYNRCRQDDCRPDERMSRQPEPLRAKVTRFFRNKDGVAAAYGAPQTPDGASTVDKDCLRQPMRHPVVPALPADYNPIMTSFHHFRCDGLIVSRADGESMGWRNPMMGVTCQPTCSPADKGNGGAGKSAPLQSMCPKPSFLMVRRGPRECQGNLA